MRQFNMIPVLLYCGLGFLLLTGSGCVSGRTITTLKPASEPGLSVPDSRFYIADLNYTLPATPYSEKQQKRISEEFKKECLSAYPKLFTDSPDGAVPLSVTISQTNKVYLGKTMCWMYGTLLISGVILPCPGQMDEAYEINVSVRGNNQTLLCTTNGFRNEYHTWCSLLTPAALMEIPGESDFPKISGSLFNMKPLEDDYYNTISRQLASAVAHAVVGSGSEFTKMTPVPAPVIAQTKPPAVEKTDNVPVDVSVPVPASLPPIPAPSSVQTAGSVVPTVKTPVADIPTQLKKLDELKSLGLITEDEYATRKAELTGKL